MVAVDASIKFVLVFCCKSSSCNCTPATVAIIAVAASGAVVVAFSAPAAALHLVAVSGEFVFIDAVERFVVAVAVTASGTVVALLPPPPLFMKQL